MLVIAHRGASAGAPENTLAAFAAALGAADGIEADVRLTADGHLVLMHDDDVSRTTGGDGRISTMTLGEVRALRVGGAEPVPTLDELLQLAGGKTRLVLELKVWFDADGFRSAAPVAIEVAGRIRGLHDVMVSSFDPTALDVIRGELPEVPTGLCCLPAVDPAHILEVAIAGGHHECSIAKEFVTPELVARGHAAGKQMASFTVNGADWVLRMRDLGVDAIYADDPEAARAVLEG